MLAVTPFAFFGCIELVEILGDRARDERELLERLEQVPLASVYCHTHSTFLQHPKLTGLFANDFANWVATQIGDRALAERLAVLDPFQFPSLEALRDALLAVLEGHVAAVQPVPRVVFGEPFFFSQSHTLSVPTGLEARTLGEFREGLAAVDASAIYFHVLDARVRRRVRGGDFARWIGNELGLGDLAEAFGRVNPYLGGLERIRTEMLAQLDAALAAEARS